MSLEVAGLTVHFLALAQEVILKVLVIETRASTECVDACVFIVNMHQQQPSLGENILQLFLERSLLPP